MVFIKQNILYRKYYGSGIILTRSLKKYGKENHTIEILKYFDSDQELRQAEKDLLTEEVLKDSLCMNLKEGGRGGFNEEQGIKGRKMFIDHLNNDDVFKEYISNNNSIKANKRNKMYADQNSRIFKVRHKDPKFKILHKEAVKLGKKRAVESRLKILSNGGKKLQNPNNCRSKKVIAKEHIHEYISQGWTEYIPKNKRRIKK